MSQVYEDQSFEASLKIKTSLQVFDSCVTESNCSQLVPELNLCAPEPSATRSTELLIAMIYVYNYAVLLSYGIPAIFPTPHPYQVIINQTLQTNNTGEIIRIPGILFNNQSANECWNWTQTLEKTANPANNGVRAFQWIICHYAPFSASALPNSSSSLFPPSDVIEICSELSWESPYYNSTNEWWVEYLGLTDEAMHNAGRILFTRDGAEQTSSVGAPLAFEGLNGRNETRTIQVWGLGHTEDLFGQRTEPQGVNPSLDYVSNSKSVQKHASLLNIDSECQATVSESLGFERWRDLNGTDDSLPFLPNELSQVHWIGSLWSFVALRTSNLISRNFIKSFMYLMLDEYGNAFVVGAPLSCAG